MLVHNAIKLNTRLQLGNHLANMPKHFGLWRELGGELALIIAQLVLDATAERIAAMGSRIIGRVAHWRVRVQLARVNLKNINLNIFLFILKVVFYLIFEPNLKTSLHQHVLDLVKAGIINGEGLWH